MNNNKPKKERTLVDRLLEENATALTPSGFILCKKNYPQKLIDKIRDDLTMVPDTKNIYNTNAGTFRIYRETTDAFILPKFYAYEKITDTPTYNTVKEGETVDLKWNKSIKLRENQKAPVKATIDAFNKHGGGILKLPCGDGKTLMSLFVMKCVNKKTMVVVPRVNLIAQWMKEIDFALPGTRVGVIKGGAFDIENKDIVIAVINSLSLNEYTKGEFDSFGMVVFDECHNYAAKMFSNVFAKVQFQYTLGLSATPYRNDGLEKVFFWYIGPIIYESFEKKKTLPIVVNVVTYNIKSKYSVEVRGNDDRPNYVEMLTNICENKERTDLFIKYIEEIAKDPKRAILVLSHRREQLIYMKERLDSLSVSCGLYMGSMKGPELENTITKQVILGIYSLCKEAFNVPKLNTLIMMSPEKNNLRTRKFDQTMGRILRKDHDINPLIIDIYDKFSLFISMYKTRRKFYESDSRYVVNDIIIDNLNDIPEQIKTEFTAVDVEDDNAVDEIVDEDEAPLGVDPDQCEFPL